MYTILRVVSKLKSGVVQNLPLGNLYIFPSHFTYPEGKVTLLIFKFPFPYNKTVPTGTASIAFSSPLINLLSGLNDGTSTLSIGSVTSYRRIGPLTFTRPFLSIYTDRDWDGTNFSEIGISLSLARPWANLLPDRARGSVKSEGLSVMLP